MDSDVPGSLKAKSGAGSERRGKTPTWTQFGGGFGLKAAFWDYRGDTDNTAQNKP